MIPRRTIKRRPFDAAAHSLPSDWHPVIRRIYATRGVADSQAMNRHLGALLAPEGLHGFADAVAHLAAAVREGKRILIVGDFDADGATASALAVLALQAMGCRSVGYLVPNRFEYGYGLTPEIVELARERAPDLIVTVDNGVSSVDGVAHANAAGIPVIVTDHHLPGERLPEALALVNPNLPGSTFGSRNTAGVGVIFYVMAGVRAHLRARSWFGARPLAEPRMADYLDLVALGTVADLVPLDSNNRILVHQGLTRIRAGRCRPGIRALLDIAGRNPDSCQASDLGFAVGPRLNAAGRLDDMSLGIECLLAGERNSAIELAAQLDRLNRERRAIEGEMKAQAEEMLAAWRPARTGELPWGLCLYDAGWHQGVIGILAARIRERYHRPVIAFAPGDGQQIKGSARSVPGLHIRDALDELAAAHPGLLTRFGGHAMAAGLTLPQEHLERFSRAFDAVVRRRLAHEDLDPVLLSDGELHVSEFSLAFADTLAEAGPWGQAFPEPLFDGLFEVVNCRIVGEVHLKLVLRPLSGGELIDAIAFRLAPDFGAPLSGKIRVAYQLAVNEFRGQKSLQLIIQHIEVCE